MNTFRLALACLTFAVAAAAVCPAQNTAFPVKLKGVLTYDDDDTLVRVPVGKRDFVGTDGLVLVLDEDLQELRLVQVDEELELVETLATSTRCVFLPGGYFAGDLAFTDLAISNAVVDITGDGTIQVRGQYTTNKETGDPYRLSGKLMGVINDPVNGNSEAAGAMFKGELSPGGKAFDADEYGL